MLRDILDKIIFNIYKWSSSYVYNNFDINRNNYDNDKDFWGDDES